MKILFYFGHPAQYLFLRGTMRELLEKGHSIKILIKTKDVLDKLLIRDGFQFDNILPEERGRSKVSIILSLLKRNYRLYPILKDYKPDLLIGTDASLAQIGNLLKIDRITITEDDYDVIKNLGKLTYPFTQTILCPKVCDVGKWEHKKVGYSGYMKLGYLHPNVFKKDASIIQAYSFPEKYIILRLAKLTAHHDFGIKGLNNDILDNIIEIIQEKAFTVFISAEGKVETKYQKYLLEIKPEDMHQVLAHSSMLICDSQSMSVEAAMLGVPSIRFSDFSGRISVLEELEHVYALTYGIKTSDEAGMLSKLNFLLNLNDLSMEFQSRRAKMLSDKIDVTCFLVWFISSYPKSHQIMKENPDYQINFK
jgi:predicted glycosyltransferase